MEWDGVNFLPPRGQMQSGQHEASRRQYHPYIEYEGGEPARLWLIADQPNMADNIYVEGSERDGAFKGFAGATLEFPLVTYPTDMLSSHPQVGKATEIHLTGPWHTNPHSFKDHTGIDLTDTCLTRVVVSEDIENVEGSLWPRMLDVCHYEEDMVLGTYDRYEKVAQTCADRVGHPVYYWMQSDSGGSGGWRPPTGWDVDRVQCWHEDKKLARLKAKES